MPNLGLLYVGLVFSLAPEEAWKLHWESFWGLTSDTNIEQFVFILSCSNLLFSLIFFLFIHLRGRVLEAHYSLRTLWDIYTFISLVNERQNQYSKPTHEQISTQKGN